MVRLSLEDDDNNGEGTSSPSTRPVPIRRRTLTGSFSCCRELEPEPEEEEEEEEVEVYEVEEEEEEEEESVWRWEPEPEPERELGSGSVMVTESEGSRGGNGSISVTLSDPDVLDCPICLDPLGVPVFQCENGHIACSSCCIKIANKCPQCCWPIGYNRCRAIEKVLESLKVPCANNRYGCKETPSYSKKADHEKTCTYVPLPCPYRACDFVGTTEDVYSHFSNMHSSAKEISFRVVHRVYIEKNQTHKFLQERSEGRIFIVNHSIEPLGSAVNIICVSPTSEKRRFSYEIETQYEETNYKLNSFTESIPNWSENSPLKKFLLVPKASVDSSSHLALSFVINCY